MMMRSLIPGLLMAGLAVIAIGASAQPVVAGQQTEAEGQTESPPLYQEGTHYYSFPVPVDTQDPDRIEVTEVFSYACIHCYRLDPLLEEWQAGLPSDVAFRRVPAIFNETWALLARLFYTAEVLGVGEKMHMPLFAAVHDRGLDVRRLEVAGELFWFEARVKPEEFEETVNSFGVFKRLRQADALGRIYRVSAVPTLVVNGKYRIESGDLGSFAEMLRIAEFLIARERTAADDPG